MSNARHWRAIILDRDGDRVHHADNALNEGQSGRKGVASWAADEGLAERLWSISED